MKRKKHNFSLIELLIVIGILGALATLVLPGFNDTSDDAKDKVARSEMRDIQTAFQRFATDVMITSETDTSDEDVANEKLYDIGLYGLWPLLTEFHPHLTASSGEDEAGTYFTYDDFDSESGIGRRAPYLEQEALGNVLPVSIDTTTQSTSAAYGQESRLFDEDGVETTLTTTEKTVKIPVIKDPYGGYYRVLVPAARTTDDGGNNLALYKRLNRMVIVCTGPNRKLDTAPTDFIDDDDDDYHTSVADDIVAKGDDIVIRLMPTAGF